jgi:hypothetical protein
MKLTRIFWIIPLALSAGCVSHRPLVYSSTPDVVTPTSEREAVRVYPSTTTTVVSPPSTVVTAPAVVTTSPAIPGAPLVVTEAPPNVAPSTLVVADNTAVAERIRSLLAEDSYLNSAARSVRFSVYNGRVTMTGRTGTNSERERLHSAIAAVPGVYQVEDRVSLNLER